MPVLESQLKPRSAEFQANVAAMRLLVQDLNAQIAKAALGGGEVARAKHTARGKLLPRDRIQMLLDPGTPFLELSQLAAFEMYKDHHGVGAAPAAGIITGIGGGVLRDLLIGEVPVVLHERQLYAVPAVVGAALTAILWATGVLTVLTALGSVGAAVSLAQSYTKSGILSGNEVAVFAAFGILWSGFLSTHVAILDMLGYRRLVAAAIWSHLAAGLVAGIVANLLYHALRFAGWV